MYILVRQSLIKAFRFNSKLVVPSSNYAKAASNRKEDKQIAKLLKHFQKTRRRNDLTDPTHPSKITLLDINEFIKDYSRTYKLLVTSDDIQNPFSLIRKFLPRQRKENLILEDVDIRGITSSGEGIALVPKASYAMSYVEDPNEVLGKYTVFLVPKTVIGDKVKIIAKMHNEYYAEGELVEVSNLGSKNSRRKDDLIVCGHFKECNGCQFQMLPYEDQLNYKQSVIKKAYQYFYPAIFNKLPEFGMVIGSPLQYSYRTKLTPHFVPKDGINEIVGFNNVNNRGKFDVKHCSIATPEINTKLTEMRENYLGKPADIRSPELTLRQSTRINHDTGESTQVALEGQKKVITEKVEDFIFQFESNSFFQNNNSILPNVLDYVKYHVNLLGKPIDNVIDTYCGVGFFGISLSDAFQENTKTFGIELAELSIKYAMHNVKINHLDPEKIRFIKGDAASLFENDLFKESGIVGKNSVVIVDPSRKGTNESFLKQLLEFEPEIIVYVSCNVFTQARDLAMLDELQKSNQKYKIRDIIGFDFFPQTKHVESVAIIEKM